MKTIGVVVKNGKDVLSFEVDPNGPKMRFIRAVAEIVEGRVTYPEGCDIITHGVRVATDNPDFTFSEDADGKRARSSWKELAFPILYGARAPAMHGTAPGSISSGVPVRSTQSQPGYSPTGRKLSEPEAQFIPLSWLRSTPNRPQKKR
jgi:hypothetical protein